MIQETGEIVRIILDRVDVCMDVEPGHEDRCGHCGLCGRRKDGSMILRVPVSAEQRPHVRKGLRVTVELDLPSPYRAIFLLLVLPLIGLIAGAVMGQRWESLSELVTLPSPLISLLFAVVGGGSLFGIGIGIERKAAAKRQAPRLILPKIES